MVSPSSQQTIMASIINTVVAEITENWRSAVLPDEEEEEFLHTLHDPDTNARHLLDDQCLTQPYLTDTQWDEVLQRLRGEFPQEAEENEEPEGVICPEKVAMFMNMMREWGNEEFDVVEDE